MAAAWRRRLYRRYGRNTGMTDRQLLFAASIEAEIKEWADRHATTLIATSLDVEIIEQCQCGERDCDFAAMGYWHCHGCGEHHRKPVSLPGHICPVEAMVIESRRSDQRIAADPNAPASYDPADADPHHGAGWIH